MTRTHTHQDPRAAPPTALGPPSPLSPANRHALIVLKNRILAYSAIKIKANPPLPYSTLNPETSSDSPSAKSNGVRLVSATQATTQTNRAGAKAGSAPNSLVPLNQSSSLREAPGVISASNTRASLISYEMAWATPRMAPTIAYLLLEAHPASKSGYKHRPIKASIKRTEEPTWSPPLAPVSRAHSLRANPIAVTGAHQKSRGLADVGPNISFLNNLTASAKG